MNIKTKKLISKKSKNKNKKPKSKKKEMKIELKGGADADASAGADKVIKLKRIANFSSFKYEMIGGLKDMELNIESGTRTIPFTYFIPEDDSENKLINVLKEKPLGSGSFGAVYKTKMKLGGEGKEGNYVIKTDLGEKNSLLSNAQDLLMREARMINIISNGVDDKNNANHIFLEGILKFKNIKYLIIDLCIPEKDGGKTVDLVSIIHKNKTYLYKEINNEKNILKWSRQIRDGLKHINSRGIIHKDLAARNILVCNGIAKISDFGLAYKDPEDKCKKCKDYEDQMLCAYPIFTTSPVVIRDFSNNFNRKKWKQKFGDFFSCDLYSYGLLLLHMFTGIIPEYSGKKMKLLAYRPDYHRVFLKYVFTLYDTESLQTNKKYMIFFNQVKYKILYPCVLESTGYKFQDYYLEEILTAGDNFIKNTFNDDNGNKFEVSYTEDELKYLYELKDLFKVSYTEDKSEELNDLKDLYEFFGGDRNNIKIDRSRRFIPSGTFDGVELDSRNKDYEYQGQVNLELKRLSEQIRILRPSVLDINLNVEDIKRETENIKNIIKEPNLAAEMNKVIAMDKIEEEIEEIEDDSITISVETGALKYNSSSSSDGVFSLYQSKIIENPQGIQYEVKQKKKSPSPSHLYEVTTKKESNDGPLYEVQRPNGKGKGPARPAVALYEVKMQKTPVYKVKSSDEAGSAPEASSEQPRPAIETIPRRATDSIPDEVLYATERALYNFLSNVTERI